MSDISSVQRLTQDDKEILVYVEEALKYLVDIGLVSLNRALELIKKPTKNNLIRVLSGLIINSLLLEETNTKRANDHLISMITKLSVMKNFEY